MSEIIFDPSLNSSNRKKHTESAFSDVPFADVLNELQLSETDLTTSVLDVLDVRDIEKPQTKKFYTKTNTIISDILEQQQLNILS